MYRVKPHHSFGILRKLLFASICIFAGVTASFAQNTSLSPEQLRQEIERLQKQLELQEQMQGQQGYSQASSARPSPQSQQSVSLRPVDTGQSAVSFNLSAITGGNSSTRPGRFQFKTNLLYAGAAMTPNLAIEFGLGRHISVELSAGYNGWHNLWDYSNTGPDWDLNNIYKTRLDHIFGKIEFRFWLRDRFKGHFFGISGFYTDYHVGDLYIPLLFDRQFDYNGYGMGASLSYGYSWRLSKIFALEFSLSGGYAMLEYDKSFIEADSEGFRLIDTIRYRKTYLGPTGAAIKLVFTIK